MHFTHQDSAKTTSLCSFLQSLQAAIDQQWLVSNEKEFAIEDDPHFGSPLILH